jgi:PRTRC genetic system protein C
MEVTELKRVFKHGDIELEDPNREMSKDNVLDFYSNQYTELTNAHVTGPTVKNDKLVYEFSTSVGTKG